MRERQKGQLMLEAVLIMFILVGAALLIQKKFSEKNMVGAMVAKPWSKVAGMMTNGSWQKEEAGKEKHPLGNGISRVGDGM